MLLQLVGLLPAVGRRVGLRLLCEMWLDEGELVLSGLFVCGFEICYYGHDDPTTQEEHNSGKAKCVLFVRRYTQAACVHGGEARRFETEFNQFGSFS